MHPIGKIIVGAILMIGSVYYIFRGIPGMFEPALPALIVVLNGAIPPFVFLIGLFIVWLELDELRIERELKQEEKKARAKRKR
ncbi:MAG: hypothetical protein QXX38_01215 [Candidatus Aenigmatarchaeota archaeon]